VKLRAWSLSDIGRKRDHNEDSYLCDEGLGLFVVADGMGGHQGGDQASRLAVDVLRREVAAVPDFEAGAKEIVRKDPLTAVLPRELALASVQANGAKGPTLVRWAGADGGTLPDGALEEPDPAAGFGDMPTDPSLVVSPPAAATVLRAAARVAGRAIFDIAQGDSKLNGMGTTLTAMLVHGGRAHLVHVGDSRAFVLRDGKLIQLTEDHSWIAEQVRAGNLSEAEARESKFRHIITRSVGFEREVEVDLLGLSVMAGDCFLLCSDGMSNYVEAAELERIFTTTFYGKIPRLLVDLANDRGGDDNVTVVVVYAGNDKG
jgi:serine/threonine protein phosphatase PrpC